MTKKIEQITADQLRTGRMCVNNHSLKDGTNPRLKKSGHCVGCYLRLPPGELTLDIETPIDSTCHPRKKYFTEEEKRHARVVSQMAWNARNKDKTKVYADTYREKIDIREKQNKYALERYHENKEAINARKREQYRLKKLKEAEDKLK